MLWTVSDITPSELWFYSYRNHSHDAHEAAYAGTVMPDDSVGLCGSADEPADLTWCVPPWGAVPYCSWKECEPGLTQVYVADGNQLRKVCRNIPSA